MPAESLPSAALAAPETLARITHLQLGQAVINAPPSWEGTPLVRVSSIVKSLATTVCGAAMLLTAAAVLDPATLQARSAAIAPSAHAANEHQRLTSALSSLISESRAILALHPATDERGVQILLWLEDAHDLGHVNGDELALIRHNRLFQTITVYSVSSAGAGAAAAHSAAAALAVGSAAGAAASQSALAGMPMVRAIEAAPLTDALVQTPGFADRWRAMTSVQARVIATGISDMRIESPLGGAMLSPLRLQLTWSGDYVDGGWATATVTAAPASGPAHDLRSIAPRWSQSQQEYTP